MITHTQKEVGEGWVEGMDTLLADGWADVSGTLPQQLFGGDVTQENSCHMVSIRR